MRRLTSDPRLSVLLSASLRAAALDAAAVLAPTSCSGCAAADRALCPACVAALAASPTVLDLDGLPVAYAHDYDGVVRSVLAAFKDGGRTDAAPHLAPALLAAVRCALSATSSRRPQPGPVPVPVHLVTVPSSRAAFRERGYVPVPLLLQHAGLRAEPTLHARRQGADQSQLSAESRRSNRAGWLEARGPVAGRRVLVVDDILTTGATLLEARRALASAGAEVVAAAVLARTPRRFPRRHDRQQEIEKAQISG